MSILVVVTPAAAQVPRVTGGAQQSWTGVWIWDATRDVRPPNAPPGEKLLWETMTILRDDGQRYVSHQEQQWDGGGITVADTDVPEDGAFHPVGSPTYPGLLSIRALPGGGRDIRTRFGKRAWDHHCELYTGGTEIVCNGVHTAADGSKGEFTCIHYRDPHRIQTSSLRRHGAAPRAVF
jgi:hypothetical protein